MSDLENAIFMSDSLSSPFGDLPNPVWRQLLIIGNGFDLQCGLPSKFSDFFAERESHEACHFNVYSMPSPSWASEVQNAGLTVWDLILVHQKTDYWYDVESAIKDWVGVANSSGTLGKVETVRDYLEDLIVHSRFKQRPVDEDGTIGFVSYYLYCSYYLTRSSVPSLSSISSIMFKELRELERSFSQYMHRVLSECTHYQDDAASLFSKLIEVERPDEKEFEIHESVLSFNYTQPRLYPMGHAIPYVNIHGWLSDDEQAESNIIFGIDAANNINNRCSVSFTKTFRLMNLGGPRADEILHIPTGALWDSAMDMIKIYGHSLSPADYSYFQAIFDSVDLYSSVTKLIFFYCDHDEIDKEAERINSMMRVTELLTTYGRTLDNKSHGGNLIHKLLLEGRLSVQYLELDDSMSD